MTLEIQVQECAERIEKLEMQRREIQWKITLEQRNYERLRFLERAEVERSILAAKGEAAKPAPHSVFFFPNGTAAVCDKEGNQMGELQGRHKFTVEALAKSGYDWNGLPEVQGVPDCILPNPNASVVQAFPQGRY